MADTEALPIRMDEAPPGLIADLVSGVAGAPGRSAKELLTIREMVREFSITSRALRFYEEKGLIAPERRGVDRLYSRRDRGRLRLVLMGKAVGFSLDDIKAMLDLYDLGDGGVTQLKVARAKFQAQVARLENQRRDIEAAIVELNRAAGVVDQRLQARRAD